MQRAGLWILAGLLCVSLAVADHSASQAEDQEPAGEDVSSHMRAKLQSSHKVLEGLVTEDFDLVRQGAEELRKTAAIADQHVANDQVYDHYSAEFRRLTEKLILMAERENLEGASFTYMHATSTCISCHQHVRGASQIAPLPKDPHVKPAGGSGE